MTTTSLPSAVNQHYLKKVMDLADVAEVAATEDIYDARGMKLVAKGSKISREWQERLIVHKLKKPLESSIQVADAVDANLIVRTAASLIDTSVPLGRILRATSGRGASPLAILSNLEFGNAMSMMLTINERDGSHALEHAVLVSLLSICMAKKLRLTDQDQSTAGLAGLLHDIGELYIDPLYLTRGKRLLPHEWAHIVVHPRIGQMLINDLESYPLAVGRAVAEHHERFDGSGYPRQSSGNNISPAGQALSVAEMIAGVLGRDHALQRAELALKIIPGEHAHDLLSAISGALRLPRQNADEVVEQAMVHASEDVEGLFMRINDILDLGRKLIDGAAPNATKTRDIAAATMGRVRTIQRAFISTGLDVYLNPDHDFDGLGDSDIEFEKAVATREIRWRLRDIARDLALQTGAPDDQNVFTPLITLLDDDACCEASGPIMAAKDAPLAAHAPSNFAGSQQGQA